MGNAQDEGQPRQDAPFDETANLVRLGPFALRHALGAALPWDDADLYYRLQAAVPF